MADFISELTRPLTYEGKTNNQVTDQRECSSKGDTQLPRNNIQHPTWVLYVDGSSNQMGSGAGLVLTTPQKVEFEYALHFNFKASNNEAEYEALIAGLRIARELGAKQIRVYSDSQLVVNQIMDDYQAKDPTMRAYLEKAKILLSGFSSYELTRIPRA